MGNPASTQNGTASVHAKHNGVERMLDHWVDRLEQGGASSEALRPEAAMEPPAATRRPLLSPVVLTRLGSSLQHLGTVTVRGPRALSRDDIAEAGLGTAGAVALDFAGHWFGAPFDAVNLRLRKGHPLAWGFWHLAGDALAAALASWRGHARDEFEALLGPRNIDVIEAGERGDGPALAVRDLRAGRTLTGELAEMVIARDPVAVVALAVAGRGHHAQRAQVETVHRRWLEPARAVLIPDTDRRVGDVLVTARALAVLFYTTFSLGTRGVERLAGRLRGVLDEPERAIASFADDLSGAGHAAEAHHVLRVLSSPELEPDDKPVNEGGTP